MRDAIAPFVGSEVLLHLRWKMEMVDGENLAEDRRLRKNTTGRVQYD
jgi:hypothetical protein